VSLRHHGKTTEEDGSSIRLASPEADSPEGEGTFFGKSSEELGKFAGVSHATIERVRTILKEGSEEQIESLRHKSEQRGGGSGSGSPGIRTVYAQVQSDKLKTKLDATQQQHPTAARHDNLKLFNKDFRTISLSEIPDESVNLVLVLVLDFPEPRIREDEGGRRHEQIVESAANWLKDGGLLVMYAEQRYLTWALCWARPPMLRFYHIISLSDPGGFYQTPSLDSIFSEEWRPLCVYVKGVRDTRPTAPQVESSDRIGGGEEAWTDEKELVCELIRRLSPANSTIVDPFMGRGIVGQAALAQGRTYIGIEPETTLFLSAMNTLHETTSTIT